MKPAAFSPRTYFVAFVTMLASLTVIGWGVWSLSALHYKSLIDGWIAQGRAAGYDIAYDNRQVFGFPRHITMRFVNLRWRNADGIGFRAGDMDLDVRPWNWRTFTAKFKNDVRLAAPLDAEGNALMMSCARGEANVKLGPAAHWRAARLDLSDAQIGLAPKYLFHAGSIEAAVARPETPPKDHNGVGLALEGEAEDIGMPPAMPSPFGDHADKFSVHMRVMGPVPDIRKRAEVAAWNNAMGTLEFDRFDVQWGALDMKAKGTLAFDDDLQPEGAFSGSVADPKAALTALIGKGYISIRDQSILDSVVQAFAKPAPNGKGAALPITVQLGGLFLGPIRILTFPEIDWPAAPPAPGTAPGITPNAAPATTPVDATPN